MADMGSKPVEPVLEDGMSGECVCLQNMVVANGYSSPFCMCDKVWKCESKYCNMSMPGPAFLTPGIKVFLANFDNSKSSSLFCDFMLSGQIKYFVFLKRKKTGFQKYCTNGFQFWKSWSFVSCQASASPPVKVSSKYLLWPPLPLFYFSWPASTFLQKK